MEDGEGKLVKQVVSVIAIATVQARRRDGVIIESFVTLRQQGTDWKVDR